MKKRLLCALFVLCMVFLLLPMAALAEETATGAEYFKYDDYNETVTITGYNENLPTDVVIPDAINGKPVTTIGGGIGGVRV